MTVRVFDSSVLFRMKPNRNTFEHLSADENEPADEAGSTDDPVDGDSAAEYDGFE